MANDRVELKSGLWVDLYELAMAQVYFKYKRDRIATFELFIRSQKRPFYVAYGIREALDYLSGIRFSKEDIDFLNKLGLFDREFLGYLRKFQFKGEVWSVDEPEIIFSQEPVLRVTANLIEAQIVESALLSTVNLHTTLATKAFRIVTAAGVRKVYDFSLRRAQGKEASLSAAKSSFVAGCQGTSNVLAGKIYGLPVSGTMAHSFVVNFSSELESFRLFSKTFPKNTVLLIDTYSIKEGIQNAIKTAKILKADKKNLIGIRIDSGNLLEESRYVRRHLDGEGLVDVLIFVSGDLDEYKIKELVDKHAPIDAFGVGTHMGTSSDLPFTDVIYKLVETGMPEGKPLPVMKISENKETLPFKKQVFRKFALGRIMKQDFIALASEKSPGKPLLKKVMYRGQVLEKREDVITQRKKLKKKAESLPKELKSITAFCKYPVVLTERLKKAAVLVKQDIKKRFESETVVFFDVDTQFDFVDRKGALFVEGADKLKSAWKQLTRFAESRNILVVSSQDIHKKKDPEFRKFNPHCIQGSKGCEKIPQTRLDNYVRIAGGKNYSLSELFRMKDNYPQVIIEKNVLDVFSTPNTRMLLEVVSPAKVYVYGVALEFCVKSACLGLVKAGYNVFLVEDAVEAVSSESKPAVLSELKKKGVKLIKAGDVLAGADFPK